MKKLMSLKREMAFVVFFSFLLLLAGSAYSQQKEVSYPNRPVTFIIPYPPGAGTDLSCRLIAREAEKFLGQSIVPINKTGTAVGTAAIATAKPDGYTIGISGHHGSFLLPLLEKVPYDPVKDFKHIVQFGTYNMGVYLKADSPFKSFKEMIAYARKNPGKVSYGTSAGGMGFFVIDEIAKKENVQLTFVPFKGSPEVQPAVLGGHITFGVGDFNYSLLEAGRLSVLLILRPDRPSEYPQIPNLTDLGYADVPAPVCIFVLGPKGMPNEVVLKLEAAFTKGMKEPGFINGMKDLRMPIAYRNNKELDEFVARNSAFFSKYLKK